MKALRPSVDALVRTHVRADVRSMQAYHVQEAAGLLKLDAMENPHRLAPELQRRLGERLGAVALNRYPGQNLQELRRALRSHAGVPEGFDLMVGNGSDELISILAMACAVPGACVLAPSPGFVMYGLSAQLQGLRFVDVPLTQDFELDEPAMYEAIREHQPAIIYLAYPNNPTANQWDDGAIENIISAAPGWVVIDEAYQPFAARSYMDRIAGHEHVLVMRTLSKFGLAGVRIGYLVGRSAAVAEFDKVRPPYNISSLNAECALFALEHAEVFAAQAQDIVEQRGLLMRALAGIPGVQAFRSDANMVLVRVAGDASAVFERMKQHGVLVKNVSATHPLLAHCLRLTVGTAEENRAMLAALEKSL